MRRLLTILLTLTIGLSYGQNLNNTNTKFPNGLASGNGTTNPTSGLTPGMMFYKTGVGFQVYTGTVWLTLGEAGAGVTSFNGRTGAVTPLVGDYSSFFVPLTRTLTINGTTQDLSANRTYTVTASTTNSLTAGYGLTGSSFDGSVARTWVADTSSVNGLVSKSRLNATNFAISRITNLQDSLSNKVNKVSKIVYVSDFGTNGEAIQAAITSAGVNGTVILSPGVTYTQTDQITLQHGTIIKGNHAVLKRGNQQTTTLTVAATQASTSITVASVPAGWKAGDRLQIYVDDTFTTSTGNPGPIILSIAGTTITLTGVVGNTGQNLPYTWPIGATVRKVYTQIFFSSTFTPNDFLIEDLTFDGNMSQNNGNFYWNVNTTIISNGHGKLYRCRFIDIPNENIYGSGTDVIDCFAKNLNGSFIHMAATYSYVPDIDQFYNEVSGNLVDSVNIKSSGGVTGHSEALITFSYSSGRMNIHDNYFFNGGGNVLGYFVKGIDLPNDGSTRDFLFQNNFVKNFVSTFTTFYYTATAGNQPGNFVVSNNVLDSCGTFDFASGAGSLISNYDTVYIANNHLWNGTQILNVPVKHRLFDSFAGKTVDIVNGAGYTHLTSLATTQKNVNFPDSPGEVILANSGTVNIGSNILSAKSIITTGDASNFGVSAVGSATSGSSFGLFVGAGTNSSDFTTLIRNKAGVDQFTIRGDGLTTSTNDINVPDEIYGPGWNSSLEVPTKNSVYDKVEDVLASTLSLVGGTLTGKITLAGITNFLDNTSPGTGGSYGRLMSTGADLIFGIDNSTNTLLLSGGGNYSSQIYTNNATNLVLGTNSNESIIITPDQVATFIESPIAPTPTAGDNSTKIATTAFVQAHVSSGTYTPVISNENVNITPSPTVFTAHYRRIGNEIEVDGKVTLTASGSITNFSVSLPPGFTSNFTDSNDIIGSFGTTSTTSADGTVYADSTNDVAVVQIRNYGASGFQVAFHFAYTIQ